MVVATADSVGLPPVKDTASDNVYPDPPFVIKISFVYLVKTGGLSAAGFPWGPSIVSFCNCSC